VNIPLVNLKRLWEQHADEWTAALVRVASSTRYIGGPEVESFERAYAEFEGAEHCVGLASGTDAVQLALIAAGVKPGDEVITVSNTFAATVEGIIHAGARPVFVDVTDDTLLVDVDAVEAAVGERTRAVLPVHLSGRPADLARLEKICDAHGIALVQDAAQAQGATFGGKPIASYGVATAYSFFPGKNLGAFGDAGGVVTNDAAVAAKLRKLRDHGRTGKYDHDEIGYNARLDPLHAAVLASKVTYLRAWNDRRRAVAGKYRELLGDSVRIVDEQRDAAEVYHHFMIRVPARDALQRALADAGVATGIHYPIPCHLLRAFAGFGYREGDLPVTERAAGEILSLPIDPTITDDEIAYVAEQVRANT
jgi:dTDP-4-amino-4,6-dideoxygalactose transaminase